MSNKKCLAPYQPKSLNVTIRRGVSVVDSREVAQMIGRPHWQLLRTIDTMVKHLSDNKIVVADFFFTATYIDEQGKPRPRFDCTRKGCDMVANKQTGERGTLFTAAYVTRFYEMDALLREKQTDAWQHTRQLSKETRKAETDVIKQFVEYASALGSSNADRYYTSLSTLANSAADIKDRDFTEGENLHNLHLVERVIAKALTDGMNVGKDYHEVFRDAKRAVNQFINLISLKKGA